MNASVSSTACRPAGADGVVKARDAAGAKVRGRLLADRSGIGFRREVDLERREHVDHQRALDDLHRARRVARRVRAERAVAADVEHRQAEGRHAGRDRRLQYAPAGQGLGGLGHGGLSSSFLAPDCRRAARRRRSPAVTSGQYGMSDGSNPLGQNCVITLNPIVRGCTRLTHTGPPSAEKAVVADSLPRSSNAFLT